jgi:nicotinamidase-related amidase
MTAYPAAPLLLCLDLQPVFLAAISDSQRFHWRCSFTLEAATGLGVPVVFTEQVPDKLGRTAADLLALAREPVVLPKATFSPFAEKKLAAYIKALGHKQILIFGLETPICVYQTAMDALKGGYKVTLLADCLGARRPGDAEAVLAQLAHDGCRVLPAETVFYSLLHEAGHPYFRDFTKLVKKYG